MIDGFIAHFSYIIDDKCMAFSCVAFGWMTIKVLRCVYIFPTCTFYYVKFSHLGDIRMWCVFHISIDWIWTKRSTPLFVFIDPQWDSTRWSVIWSSPLNVRKVHCSVEIFTSRHFQFGGWTRNQSRVLFLMFGHLDDISEYVTRKHHMRS